MAAERGPLKAMLSPRDFGESKISSAGPGRSEGDRSGEAGGWVPASPAQWPRSRHPAAEPPLSAPRQGVKDYVMSMACTALSRAGVALSRSWWLCAPPTTDCR